MNYEYIVTTLLCEGSVNILKVCFHQIDCMAVPSMTKATDTMYRFDPSNSFVLFEYIFVWLNCNTTILFYKNIRVVM